MPDKWHGLTETDTRYRQREEDLLANPDSRRVFDIRFKAIAAMRRHMESEHFVEVETPMMQPIPGGATARPFITHHNALDMPLYLRIAPELYLKRLIVGGFEKVFEINRNFRNEGLSVRHNPEFTMLESYAAGEDLRDVMALTEGMFNAVARQVMGAEELPWGERSISYTLPFRRLSLKDAIAILPQPDAGTTYL